MEELSKDMIGALNNKSLCHWWTEYSRISNYHLVYYGFSGHSINPFHEKFKDCSILSHKCCRAIVGL